VGVDVGCLHDVSQKTAVARHLRCCSWRTEPPPTLCATRTPKGFPETFTGAHPLLPIAGNVRANVYRIRRMAIVPRSLRAASQAGNNAGSVSAADSNVASGAPAGPVGLRSGQQRGKRCTSRPGQNSGQSL
jgi:hypothetical protein